MRRRQQTIVETDITGLAFGGKGIARLDGLAVIEAPNTTLFVPHDWHVRIDEHLIYWLTRKGVSKKAAARPAPARHAKKGGKR